MAKFLQAQKDGASTGSRRVSFQTLGEGSLEEVSSDETSSDEEGDYDDGLNWVKDTVSLDDVPAARSWR